MIHHLACSAATILIWYLAVGYYPKYINLIRNRSCQSFSTFSFWNNHESIVEAPSELWLQSYNFNSPRRGHAAIWAGKVAVGRLELMNIFISRRVGRQSSCSICLLFSHWLKRHPVGKLHQASLKIRCPVLFYFFYLTTVHFPFFFFLALWRVNDQPTVSSHFPAHFTLVQFICVGDISAWNTRTRSILPYKHGRAAGRPCQHFSERTLYSSVCIYSLSTLFLSHPKVGKLAAASS